MCMQQGTTGPTLRQGLPWMDQQFGEFIIMKAAQPQGLQSDALETLRICEGCPQQHLGKLRASCLALRDL